MQIRFFPHITDQSPTDYIEEDMASTFRQAKELRDEFTSRHHTVSQHHVYVCYMLTHSQGETEA